MDALDELLSELENDMALLDYDRSFSIALDDVLCADIELSDAEYLDLALQYGLLVVAPAPPPVVEAVAEAAGIDDLEVLQALVTAVEDMPMQEGPTQEEVILAEREAREESRRVRAPAKVIPAEDVLPPPRTGIVEF
jgi:hypothetical protein